MADDRRSLDQIVDDMMTEHPDLTAGELKRLFCQRYPAAELHLEQYSRGWLLRVISSMVTARRETDELEQFLAAGGTLDEFNCKHRP